MCFVSHVDIVKWKQKVWTRCMTLGVFHIYTFLRNVSNIDTFFRVFFCFKNLKKIINIYTSFIFVHFIANTTVGNGHTISLSFVHHVRVILFLIHFFTKFHTFLSIFISPVDIFYEFNEKLFWFDTWIIMINTQIYQIIIPTRLSTCRQLYFCD